VSWVLASFLLLGLALTVGFAWYERSHPSARVLALVATLAALAALGRIAFAPLPNVKPTTDIVLLTGYALGGAPGFAVGAVAALASNLFFGQGPWTPWQMAGWGLAGLIGAGLARVWGRELGRVTLAVACAAAGFAYGAVMNVSMWVTYSGDHSLDKLWFYVAGSFPFDVAHALGNAVFCLAFGPALVRALRRYRTRFDITWRPAPATAGLAVALLALAVAAPPRADADVPPAAVRYLERAQNADGGFGPAPGASSTQMHTGWAALGLAAAGRNPRDVERAGRSVLDYMSANAAKLRGDLGERSRTILALRAAGVPPTRLGGRDLLGELVRAQERDGSFAGLVNTTAFAVLALRAAGRPATNPAVRKAAAFIAGQANADGGFNFGGKGGPSGADDTGAALQALAAAGRRRSKVVRRAADWLERAQRPDGGFALQAGPSNAQSTAWAAQGLIAAGRNPARVRRGGSRSPLAYLRSLVGADGAIRYSRTSTQTPVWVTAQALTALAGKALPLAPAPRKRRAHAAAPTPTPTATPEPRNPEPKPAPTAQPAALAAAPSTPAITPLTLFARTLPALISERTGLLAALITRTWLPRT
jgi:Squalene-hopene cyclase C-terminal domain/ECF transporter, substrate-specific component/Prenyltransferase and squalene oxidase repeat